MKNQITPSVTTPTISDLYERISEDKIDLSPDFQRKFVWTHVHQEEFIDTILHGYPFPEIYVCQDSLNILTKLTTQKVIDGQQRLTTIVNYIEGNFDKPLKIINSFEKLSEKEQTDFLTYKVVVRDLGDVEDNLVREIFRRINLTKFKLEDVEIHNAVYDGIYIQTAKEIAKEIKLQNFDVFYDSEFTRMGDIYFVLRVMSTIDNGGYFNRESEVEKNIAKFNEDYQKADEIKTKFSEVLKLISNLNLKDDSIWFRKSNFFTLVVELINAEIIPKDLKQKLEDIETKILKNRGNKMNKYGKYYNYMYQGTNNRIARITRGKLFEEEILG